MQRSLLAQRLPQGGLRCVGRRIVPLPTKRPLSLWSPPKFANEKEYDYAPGSPERAKLTESIKSLKSTFPVNIPLQISGQTIASRKTGRQQNPCDHQQVIAEYGTATPDNVNAAIDAALKAKPAWEALPFEDRAAIFLRASELVTGKYRADIVAATMLNLGKNIRQAEIDAPAETADFFRHYIDEAWKLYAQQPKVQTPRVWNKMEYRPLEGFVYAVSPFNFVALGATLIGPAALMGNVVLWKPSDSSVHASWLLYQILLEAGLPKGVIQFLPGNPEEITDTVLKRPEFSALTFIGSTKVFKGLQKKIGNGVGDEVYNSYPRIVGETGGKNWSLIHPTADIKSAALNTVRAAFEYQGQKCSANSRVYIAESVWPEYKKYLEKEVTALKVGDVEEYENFINPVIHEASFDKLDQVIQDAKNDAELDLVVGGKTSKSKGYYVHPTIYRTTNPHHRIMTEELFGPILVIYVYPDNAWEETMKLVDSTSRYALTGSVFAQDPYVLRHAQNNLRHAAGNFYLNTKCTGAVVAQQPFGGSRDSGTNDKTGTMAHLQRFVSTRTIKEEFVPLENVLYPSNAAE